MAITTPTEGMSALRLWQLISPALPVGAYAYSQALEYAVHAGWVDDEATAGAWIGEQVRYTLAHLDVPVLRRCQQAWSDGDEDGARAWSRYLLASREAGELLAEDRHLGRALAQVLCDAGIATAEAWCAERDASFACLFALAAAHWTIAPEAAAQGYLWAWCENQVAAAIKLVPLGQRAGQRLLGSLMPFIEEAAATGLALEDTDIGMLAPGLGIASALHETQYSRLFRS